MRKAIFLFRNDLRLRNNQALLFAQRKYDYLIPTYILENEFQQEITPGLNRMGEFRLQFLLESLQNLKQNLQSLNSDLLFSQGKILTEILQLAKENQVSVVVCTRGIGYYETQLEAQLEKELAKIGVAFESIWGETLYHVEDLPFPIKKTPPIFTDFRKALESDSKVRKELEAPTTLATVSLPKSSIPSLKELIGIEPNRDLRAACMFKGGEDAAWERLNAYFFEGKHLGNYKQTRNELLGADYSSKFSAWLALGCISPNSIYWQVKAYEEKILKNDSTYWLIFELLWRDFFKFTALNVGNKLFLKGGLKGHNPKTETYNLKLFEAWKEGQTGIPFVDANMRELKYTGFMSNRGRQNVASFLVNDLKLPWQWGARYFESILIDYDVSSNWGNWCYVAGVGNDPRDNRYFNILKQAQQYDKNATYIKHWLPELAHLDAGSAHQPWDYYKTFSGNIKTKAPNYPKPLVQLKGVPFQG